ncbi:glycine-rich protein DOT1-like [Eucalyptus grandis]|uniref:glycine-rich protein DOT1-like n=1 Tax=Eucalyptus grandis TaxID=71139 RepID=UPI00192E913A|nr:glycine-rich protein DOT1-like [Eucalyptus grandis]
MAARESRWRLGVAYSWGGTGVGLAEGVLFSGLRGAGVRSSGEGAAGAWRGGSGCWRGDRRGCRCGDQWSGGGDRLGRGLLRGGGAVREVRTAAGHAGTRAAVTGGRRSGVAKRAVAEVQWRRWSC